MLKYRFNKDLGFLETEADGNVSLMNIIEHYTLIANGKSLPDKLLILVNCANIEIDVNNREIKRAMASLNTALKSHKFIKEAIIVSKPHSTVIALLFESMAKQFKNYSFKVFSTQEAAREWLLSNQ